MLNGISGRSLLAGAAVAAVFALAGGAGAQNMKSNTPQPGQCKVAAEVGVANSPVGAQQIWTTTVAGKHGNKWAAWVGAKDKVVVPINNGTLYQAVAKPCFHNPVL